MSEKQYVALKQLRLGDRTIRPGEDVPILPGRSYHQMVSLGQIAEKPEAAPAALPDGAYSVVLLIDNRAFFVDYEGQATEVLYHGTQEPDEVARVTLDLELGQLAALVEFPDDPEPTLVTLGSLVWGDAARVLALKLQETETARADLVTQLTTATTAATEATKSTGGLQSQVDWLRLVLKAVQTPGAPLADNQIGGKELATVGITTQEGLQLLASGEQAVQNLVRLEGIGKKLAERIFTSLAAPPEPSGSTSPVSDQPPSEPPATPEG